MFHKSRCIEIANVQKYSKSIAMLLLNITLLVTRFWGLNDKESRILAKISRLIFIIGR